MAKRTIRVRHWRHKTTDGGYRISQFGEEVDLPEAEVERGDHEGVFTPAPIPETRSADVDRKLADILSRVPLPAGSDESDAAPLHHDIQPALDRSVARVLALHDEPAVEDETETEPAPATGDDDQAPAGDPDANTDAAQADQPPAAELKRPAKAAAHEKWVDYVATATGRPADELAELSKDELQAIKV
ncbi:hypothetical protein A5722_14635 [Mycobacterium vulneris]|nr:hypothetical protein A5722_14635 [Mycolicibacterium vulneris]OCB66168.1 hypothetical protein A5729_12140 [Mycolicibacterium vulneris]